MDKKKIAKLVYWMIVNGGANKLSIAMKGGDDAKSAWIRYDEFIDRLPDDVVKLLLNAGAVKRTVGIDKDDEFVAYVQVDKKILGKVMKLYEAVMEVLND